MKSYRKKTQKVIYIIILCIALSVFIFAGTKLWKIWSTYHEANTEYKKIESIFPENENQKLNELQQDKPDVDTIIDPFDYDVPFEYDYQILKSQFPDAIGWIYLKDKFSYPIFFNPDKSDFYLYHLPDGTYNSAGSLFVDPVFENGLNGTYSIIYGHNMNNGSMFGRLHSYHNYENFANQSKLHVFIEDHHYIYKVIGTFEASTSGFIYTSGQLDTQDAYDVFLTNVRNNREYSIDYGYLTPFNNPVITLSTCTTSLADSYRYVVVIARDHEVKN